MSIISNNGLQVLADMFSSLHIKSNGGHVVIPFEDLRLFFDILRPFQVVYSDKTLLKDDRFWIDTPVREDVLGEEQWYTTVFAAGKPVARALGYSRVDSLSNASVVLAGIRALAVVERES